MEPAPSRFSSRDDSSRQAEIIPSYQATLTTPSLGGRLGPKTEIIPSYQAILTTPSQGSRLGLMAEIIPSYQVTLTTPSLGSRLGLKAEIIPSYLNILRTLTRASETSSLRIRVIPDTGVDRHLARDKPCTTQP